MVGATVAALAPSDGFESNPSAKVALGLSRGGDEAGNVRDNDQMRTLALCLRVYPRAVR